jgi:peptide/nickel transport system substrate-binding protein
VERLTPWDLNNRGAEHVADLIYNGLVQLDAQGRPQPDLAERWEPSSDGTAITFTLREDVRWHDGEPFSADDVAWTLNILRTITPTSSLLYDLRTTIEGVDVVDERTVALQLREPYAPLLAELSVPILPRHRLQDRSPEDIAGFNFWEAPIGTGPFRFDRREADQAILFTRNDDFYAGAPYLDQVALLIAPDKTVAATALGNNDLQLAEFGGPTEVITDVVLPDNTTRGTYTENGWYGVVFNTREGRVFADGRVREALARAVDVPAIVRDIVGDNGAPIATTIVSNTWAYPGNTGIAAPDLEAARQLLDEAGWIVGGDGIREREGQRLAVQLFVRGDDARRVAAAQRIAQAAGEIGIAIEVVPSNFDTVILAKLAPPYDFDLVLGSWVNAPNSAGFPTNRFYDPDDYGLFHSSRVWNGDGDTRTALRNVGGFRNGDYDAAAERARRTYDLDERANVIAEAQAVLARERPYLYLWSNRFVVALNEQIRSNGEPIDLNSPRPLWNVEDWYVVQNDE